MRRILAAALALPLVLAAVPAMAEAPQPLTFEVLRRVVGVREPQISPDGTRIAYVRRVPNFTDNRTDTELVLVDVATGAHRPLTQDRAGVHLPEWSPDGTRLAFLASPVRGKPAQLFVMPMNGGEPRVLTKAKGGVAQFAWRPDGNAFAYAAQDDPPKSTAPDGYVDAFRVTNEHFLTREPSKPEHIWTISADGSGAKQLTRSNATPNGNLAWTPDGARIVITLQPDAVFASLTRTHVSVVDAATGTVTPFGGDAISSGGLPAHTTARVAVEVPVHGTPYLGSAISIRDAADGHEVASPAGFDHAARWYAWTPNDDALMISAADGVRLNLWRWPIGRPAERVDLGDLDFDPSWASIAKNGTMAFIGDTRTNPGELYVLAPGGAPRKLSDENGFLKGYTTARRERFDWVSSDGVAVNGVLTYPTDYVAGKRYPLVLTIHGGPVATSNWDMGGNDATIAEILANHGFLVLQPNYRGSDNGGDAFLSAIVPGVTSGPGRDNLAAVEALKKSGMVDPDRIGVGGWSGGGLQTSWLIGHATYWKAAVAGAGVYDWVDQSLLADINEPFGAAFLGGASPWTADGRRAYRAESPLTYADAIRTPLLILSDTGDQRVPITQSYALYNLLKARGRTVSFIAYPRPGHFPGDPVGAESVRRQWTGWLERWIPGGGR